ncbi:MAG: S8 family serine peptidase [Ignavibacteriaceae bacterium]|nr:S8 family serine peptidase [Ignavibacteriaceae bacterium]
MKHSIFSFIILLIISSNFALAQTTYFIKYKENVPLSDIEQKVQQDQFIPSGSPFQIQADLKSVDYLAKGIAKSDEVLGRIIKLTFTDDVDEGAFLQLQSLDENIEYVQKATTYQLDFVPDDSLVSQQWALSKIQAFDAWDKTQGADSVLIGVIDTGIDYFHPDLQNKIYQNPGEIGIDAFGNDKRTNGIDDDNNGFIDDYRGWDFTDRVGFPFDSSGGDYLGWDNDPMDEQGHGTYISGIAAAQTNNFTGIAGAAPNIKLMNLRAFDPGGYGEEDDVAAAILYAVQMGVKVLNMSFGDYSFSFVLRDVVQFVYSQNMVLVGSSGNQNSSNPHYPSGYSEVICVGNSTQDDFRAGNSNYGSTLDLMAPGTQIVTTARNNNYASIGGTSAATPFVAATAALILSLGNFTNEEVKQILKSTSDDIGEPGWDIYTGAGRLNMYRAVTVTAPSAIKINHPKQDFATLDDSLKINATVLSPLFSNYSLYYGYGLNPTNWISLIEQGSNQFSNQDIFTLNLTSLPDTVYCLRLVVQLTNGRTSEERANFFISRNPPVTELISVGPAFYGDKTTILAAMYTDEPTVTRMYYRKFGELDFNFITLDGFTTNNQFVKYLHYGFLPKQLVEQNSAYEIYFESENLVGLKTIVKNNGQNFLFTTNYEAEYAAETLLPFTLPAGGIFQDPVNITQNELSEVYVRTFTNSRVTNLFKLNNDNFEVVDSLQDRIIRDFGDFNKNGLKDLLTSWVRNGYILEQQNSNSSSFNQKYADETGKFWPIMAEDIDGDGVTEVVVVNSDTSVNVWKVNNDLTLSNPITLRNFTERWIGNNILDAPNGVLADVNSDGIKEIWFVDLDGDLFSYNILGTNSYQTGSVINTGFLGSAAYLAVGDYNGDNKDELAVLLHSIDAIDIAPYYLMIVFNLLGNQLNILYDQVFVDASTEFRSSFQQSDNSIRFADLDDDGWDELIVFMFPYSYIFKHQFVGSNKIISFKENINSNSVFIGDLNYNNVQEVAFPTDQGINFYEFTISKKASTPYNVNGYSIDSSSIFLSWQGSVDQYYIYRGLSADKLILIDSVISAVQYVDFNLNKNTNYYYGIQAFDLSKEDPYSNISKVIEVYCHTPGKVISVTGTSSKTVTVKFSEKMSNTIENLQAFKLNGNVFANSIAPASQYSYLVTFRDEIPVGLNELSAGNLRDLYGSPIEPTTVSFEMDSVIINPEFFISSFKIVDAYSIKLVFNLEVDEQSAENVSNYIFDPDNKASSVSVDASNKKIVNISLNGEKPIGSIGREYVLRVKDLFSSTSTGSLKINEGAGSYIVLSSFANDLSDVYVYPNPVKPTSGEALTFANLPRYAQISIWTVDGTKIGEIEESDGNGGATFDLKDLNGNTLSSGIYIYRIVMTDESKNEQEEKLGKFAVIK